MLSFKQTTKTDVFPRVVSCSTMSMKGEVHVVCYCKSRENEYTQLLGIKSQLSSSFLVTRYLALETFSIFFFLRRTRPYSKQWRNIPNQLMTKVNEIL